MYRQIDLIMTDNITEVGHVNGKKIELSSHKDWVVGTGKSEEEGDTKQQLISLRTVQTAWRMPVHY